jgi:hypothetical protein
VLERLIAASYHASMLTADEQSFGTKELTNLALSEIRKFAISSQVES